MAPYVFALLIGVAAGLRAIATPAAVSWAAYLGWLNLAGTWAAFLGHAAVAYPLGLIGIGELIGDQLPTAPSRKSPVQLAARVLSGGFCGAVLAGVDGSRAAGLVLGVLGALIGTFGGYAARTRLSRADRGRDHVVGLAEDALALLAAFVCATSVG